MSYILTCNIKTDYNTGSGEVFLIEVDGFVESPCLRDLRKLLNSL